jgi:lipopolysaccharide transport system ATP-binding protein
MQGDRVGIIGRNGAGKSTLLKILSRITVPTTGTIGIKGRVASLLEVGTGFHPELTGRENIFLNSAILGMTKQDISARFDEIVDFAEVEKFLDTPVKRYSSGMYVRLAFSVAAHLEPDIFIVDEVLAVGDMGFQKKCLGKMEEAGKSGRTLLFVSHNNSAIKSLCDRGIVLTAGQVTIDGEVDEVVDSYLSSGYQLEYSDCVDRERLKLCDVAGFKIDNIEVLNTSNPDRQVCSGDDLSLRIHYSFKGVNPSPALVISLKDGYGVEVARFSHRPISGVVLVLKEQGVIVLTIANLPLVKGSYYIDVGYVHEKVEWFFNAEALVKLDVNGADVYNSGFELDQRRGLVWMSHKWESS